MRSGSIWLGLLMIGLAGPAEAAPTSTSLELDRAVQAARAVVPQLEGQLQELAAGVKAYAEAATPEARGAAAQRVAKAHEALRAQPIPEVVQACEEASLWLNPRVEVDQARLAFLGGRSPGSPYVSPHRLESVRDKLLPALVRYDTAKSLDDRLDALGAIHELIYDYKADPTTRPIASALGAMFLRPNVGVRADYPTLAAFLERDVAEPGPIYRKGQVSMVYPGPKIGFGVLPSDEGLSFFNRQFLTAVTDVKGFSEQVASQDSRGRMLTQIYDLGMTTSNTVDLTIIGTFTPNGLRLKNQATDNVDIRIRSTPRDCTALRRGALDALGLDQASLEKLIYENAIKRVREEVPREATQERSERLAKAEAEQNRTLRKYLVGDGTLAFNPIEVRSLKISSRPDSAVATGILQWRQFAPGWGADAPLPAAFRQPQPGVTVHAHLPSLAHNLWHGWLGSEGRAAAKNVMLMIRVAPKEGLKPGVESTTWDASNDDFVKAVAVARKDKDLLVVRIARPKLAWSPTVGEDSSVGLLIRDLEVQLSAPVDNPALRVLGNAVESLALTIPRLELRSKITATPSATGGAPGITLKFEEIDPGQGLKILTTNANGEQSPVNAFLSGVVVRTALQQVLKRELPIALPEGGIPGFRLVDVSPPDPSGWIQVRLERDPNAPVTPPTEPEPILRQGQ